MPITNINNTNEKPQLTQAPQSNQTEAAYDYAQTKKEQNSAIVRSQMDVSLKMGNEPMALLYKTALSAINEALDPTQETKPIQTAAQKITPLKVGIIQTKAHETKMMMTSLPSKISNVTHPPTYPKRRHNARIAYPRGHSRYART